MQQTQNTGIRLVGLYEADAPFVPGNPEIPAQLRGHSRSRLVVFGVRGRLGMISYITIPVSLQSDDAMIAEARAALHEMLSALSEESQIWKQSSQEGGGTP